MDLANHVVHVQGAVSLGDACRYEGVDPVPGDIQRLAICDPGRRIQLSGIVDSVIAQRERDVAVVSCQFPCESLPPSLKSRLRMQPLSQQTWH